MHSHENVNINWILSSVELKNEKNQLSFKQKDIENFYNFMFSNESKNINKNKKMIINFIHIS